MAVATFNPTECAKVIPVGQSDIIELELFPEDFGVSYKHGVEHCIYSYRYNTFTRKTLHAFLFGDVKFAWRVWMGRQFCGIVILSRYNHLEDSAWVMSGYVYPPAMEDFSFSEKMKGLLEAGRLARDFYFANGGQRLHIMHDTRNRGVARIAKLLGFAYRGEVPTIDKDVVYKLYSRGG